MTPAYLPDLLATLRAAGLRVGVDESERLRRVLELWEPRPGEGVERLVSLCAAVIAKTPAERSQVAQALELWVASTHLGEPEEGRLLRPRDAVRRRGRIAGFWLLGSVLAAALVGWQMSRDPQPVQPPPAEPQVVQPLPTGIGEVREAGTASTTRLEPYLVVLPSHVPWPGWPELVLALLGVAMLAKTFEDLRRRPALPGPAPPPRPDGPARALLRAPPGPGIAFFSRADEEALVWGVGRYLAEERSRRLDATATVRATARAAGQIRPVFHRRRPHREVWLWLDESAAGPDLGIFAGQISTALSRAGLPVERGSFWGLPDQIRAADGRIYRPRELEEGRQEALVAVLTDGRLLASRLRSNRPLVDSTLRDLGRWPHLELFAPGSLTPELQEALRHHQVPWREPKQLASLAAQDSAVEPSAPEAGVSGLWAAACAVCPGALDETTAERLRRELGLGASPWQLAELRAEAKVAEGWLHWRGAKRRERVNWLRGAEAPGPQSHFARAVAFFERHYQTGRGTRAADPTFVHSLADVRLQAEEALLVFLARPHEAIARLFAFFQATPELRKLVGDALGELDVADGASDKLRLAERWSDFTPREQVLLAAMGFAGRRLDSRQFLPARHLAALAAAAGIVLALGAAAWIAVPRDEGESPRVKAAAGLEVRLEAGQSPGLTQVHARFGRTATIEPGFVEPGFIDPGYSDKTWRVSGAAKAELRWRPVEVPCALREQTDAAGITMVHLCGGTFLQGTADGDPRADLAFDDEKPAHLVTLSDFWIAKYEVTHAQFRRFKAGHRSEWDLEDLDTSQLPVTDVDWHDAQGYCASLGYRLPTESEWEYAARAGERGPWSFGTEAKDLGRFAWYGENSEARPHPIGTKEPNVWGLFDLYGNVLEWTATDWADYSAETQVDPPAVSSPRLPVLRGGAYWGEPRFARSAYRLRFQPGGRVRYVGFRCVRAPLREHGPSLP